MIRCLLPTTYVYECWKKVTHRSPSARLSAQGHGLGPKAMALDQGHGLGPRPKTVALRPEPKNTEQYGSFQIIVALPRKCQLQVISYVKCGLCIMATSVVCAFVDKTTFHSSDCSDGFCIKQHVYLQQSCDICMYFLVAPGSGRARLRLFTLTSLTKKPIDSSSSCFLQFTALQ